jgi:hypothetical protein
MAPASLTSWWLGWAEDSQPVRVRLAEVSGIVVAELAGFGKTMLVAHFLGPSPSWPLVIVVIDEAHTFFHERKGTSPEVKAHNALVAEVARLVEELVRKGRNVAIQVMLLTQRATGDAIPTRIRDNCQVVTSFATRTLDDAVAALGDPPPPRRLPGPAQRPSLCRSGRDQPARPPGLPPGLDPPGGPPPGRRHHPRHRGLRADPAALLAEQALGLRVVSPMPAPGDAA